MNINITLILQSIAMMVFVWFCMKFIWPPLMTALELRREKIAEGLAASDRAEQALDAAKGQVDKILEDARGQAGTIMDQAQQRRNQIVDHAKVEAVTERDNQVSAAEAAIQQSANHAREELKQAVASLAVLGAEKIIEKEIDEAAHRDLLEKLIAEI
jgi:F-type H+-transporting ATPase subunit b